MASEISKNVILKVGNEILMILLDVGRYHDIETYLQSNVIWI